MNLSDYLSNESKIEELEGALASALLNLKIERERTMLLNREIERLNNSKVCSRAEKQVELTDEEYMICERIALYKETVKGAAIIPQCIAIGNELNVPYKAVRALWNTKFRTHRYKA